LAFAVPEQGFDDAILIYFVDKVEMVEQMKLGGF